MFICFLSPRYLLSIMVVCRYCLCSVDRSDDKFIAVAKKIIGFVCQSLLVLSISASRRPTCRSILLRHDLVLQTQALNTLSTS